MKLKKATALLLAGVMTLSVAGCGGQNTSGDSSGGTASASSEAAGTEAAEEPPAASDTAAADSGEVPTLTMFIDETWWPYDTWEGAIPEEFENRLGVNIEVIRAADNNQLSLMVASGDMPDIICSYRYQYLADSQVCYPLNELQEQ